MAINIKEVHNRKDLKDFIFLPEKLNAGREGWVPPFYSDDKWVLDPQKNPAHSYCESVYILAHDGKELAGRAAGIINRRYNDYAGAKTARFGFFECARNFEAMETLVRYLEDWARSRGMEKLVGPMGFTEEDPLGFIFEGYDETPSLACYQNEPWMNEYVEKLGYGKELDYFVYKLDIDTAMTDIYRKLFERAGRSKAFKLVEFKTKKQLKPYVKPIFELMNESFDEIYGYSPLDEADVEMLAARYMPLLDPRFVKLAVSPENKPVGFMVSIPNMAPGIIKARGRLFPLGIFHLLKAAKNSTQLDNYLGAVQKEFRAKGVDILIGYAQLRSAREAGFEFMDSHHEMEDNLKMRAEMERAGAEVYKKFRVYQKEL